MSMKHTLVSGITVMVMHLAYRYEDHWWWDNVAHLLGGYAVGCCLVNVCGSRRAVLLGFLATTTGWELFEYIIGERPWDGSMTWDHAMEDTVLDTYAGLTGAYLATVVHG